MGPDIWGLQNRAKGPKYFSKKGYFGHKTGPQKPDAKDFFDVEEHLNSKRDVYDLKFVGPLELKFVAPMPEQFKTTTMHFNEASRKPY